MVRLQLENSSIPADILEQLNLLITTPMGTVVLDRDFGIDMSFIDMPTNFAKNMVAVELAKKIKKYIPELRLVEVKETESRLESGELALKVVVEVAE